MPPRLRASIKRSANRGRPIGYAREGADEQSLALQLAALQKAGCAQVFTCLLYTSDAADEEDSVDLGGRRIIKKKKK